jgi:hypothetical protein
MRREVIALCEEGAYADGHLSEGEAAFIQMLRAAWQMPEAYDPHDTRPLRRKLKLVPVQPH